MLALRRIPAHRVRVESGTTDGGPEPTRTFAMLSCLAAVVGIALIGVAYARATEGRSGQYLLFYVGLLVVLVLAALALSSSKFGRTAQLIVITGIGLFLYIPKLLRNPTGPLYHDELAHWRQTTDIAASGHLFVPNTTIPIISSYPGLHIVTLTIDRLTGLSVWGSGILLLAVVHVIDLLAVYLIVETAVGSPRAGALGALLFSLNPSFMYFDDQFGYESLGIALFLLTVLAVLRAERSATTAGRAAWGAAAVLTAASCAVTHHLSTVVLCGVLLVWSCVAVVQAHRGRQPAASSRTVVAVTLVVLAVFAAWVSFVATGTFDYLKPYLGNAVGQLTSFVGGGGGSRTPFAQASNPIWERLSAFLSPLATGIAALLTFRHVWRSDPEGDYPNGMRAGAGTLTLFVFGLVYFISIPFILAPSGAEGARRSWGFTYLGVTIVLAPTIARWLNRSRHRMSSRRGRRVRLALVLLFVVVLIGNVGAGLDPSYRFPGPYALGSDTYSLTPELRALAAWFDHSVGPGNLVVADRFTGLALGALGRQFLDAPSDGFPTYQLFLDHSVPSPQLLGELKGTDYEYLVIDTRMDKPVADLSGFFTGGSDTSSDGTVKVTETDLNRFANYPWLNRVYQSTDYVVYRFHYGDLAVALAPQARLGR